MRFFLGIDPGLSGALAFYDPVVNEMQVFDMPTHNLTVNGKKKRKLDLTRLTAIVDDLSHITKMACVEEVGAMPGQGVTSMFSFGFSAGCAQMVVAANYISMTLVRPAIWKKAMGVKADKDSARLMASRLLPMHAHHWPLVKHDGRAEAALLALYLARSHATPGQEPLLEDLI